ncbi:MAG: hypothetical protein EOP84_19885 [Verrucomicrobiaceae bacterium]|nr:MAG: hypothetical protein EOP84_19885 [Verrucomicrobiaceae bacterium]
MSYLLSFLSVLLALSILTALRTMRRPEIRYTRLGFSEAPANLGMKKWLLIFPLGLFTNLIHPLNWLMAAVFAAVTAGVRAVI